MCWNTLCIFSPRQIANTFENYVTNYTDPGPSVKDSKRHDCLGQTTWTLQAQNNFLTSSHSMKSQEGIRSRECHKQRLAPDGPLIGQALPKFLSDTCYLHFPRQSKAEGLTPDVFNFFLFPLWGPLTNFVENLCGRPCVMLEIRNVPKYNYIIWNKQWKKCLEKYGKYTLNGDELTL